MARLSDLDIIRCTECGKLIQKQLGRSLCAECAASRSETPPSWRGRENRSINAAAHAPLFSHATAKESASDATEGSVGHATEKCVRCKARPAVEESDLCIYCMLDLYRSLGDASNELFGRMEVLEEEPASRPTVVSLLKDKEQLIGSSHFDFASGPHLRW